ncbi:SDR family NAD(P)-dependent oxidoreductase [Dactylosporangium vinaceum]|uniref:SDR family NAD(P)-dependent oxidoreductase n=1 Tax=Dactylosporangium vinaceum TaxID=53362 RepID=A0ABV5MR07_9ACTN|nr:SDR family NAD(P)-dependent oxidoreductase [Dactylosporangium vinaceum]UAC00669.1 SDR family NAD(P)-dependent oxidoreductase [Dactylosporangium vinaceum]
MNFSTALVTGANKGIGRHIAQQLADAGLTVYVGSRDRARGEAAAREIGAGARPVQLDVTDPASIAAAARVLPELDILVNNAGVIVDGATAPELTVEALRQTFETNLFAVLAVTNALLPVLQRSAHPRIVNISSGTGSLTWSAEGPFPATGAQAAYRSSKTALNALTLFYAQALPGFRINALAPGLRRTDLNDRAAASDGDPAEAAAAAVRLALLADDGPTGLFHQYDGTIAPW